MYIFPHHAYTQFYKIITILPGVMRNVTEFSKNHLSVFELRCHSTCVLFVAVNLLFHITYLIVINILVITLLIFLFVKRNVSSLLLSVNISKSYEIIIS